MYSIVPNEFGGNVQLIGVEADRALERPWRPCQEGMAVVNVAAGCSFGCLFCPLQQRGHGLDEIQLRANLPTLLENELIARRRAGKLPSGVVVDTTTDIFQPIGPVLTVTHEVLRIVLAEGLNVFFQTRGIVPEGFKDLLSKHAEHIHVQVVIFSIDEDVTRLYEPRAPRPQDRLESIRKLLRWGTDVRVRIEPLVPFISDTAGHLEDLVRHLRSAGAQKATVAYLVLQPQTLDRLQASLPSAHFHVIKGSFRGQTWQKAGIHQNARMLSEATRIQGYQRLANIARKAGMEITVCGCQDQVLGGSCMSAPGSMASSVSGKEGQLDLFPTG